MKKITVYLIAAFVLSQAEPVAIAQPKSPPYVPVPKSFDLPYAGTTFPTDTQSACAKLGLGSETCGLNERILRLIGGNGAITFHNDTISMIDTSEELQLRKMLISKTSGSPHFHQHTHGKEHALFVASRSHGVESLNRYKLLPGDTLEIYLGDVATMMPDMAIINHKATPNVTMTVKSLTTLEDPGCPHTPKGAKLDWWILDTNGVSWGPEQIVPDPDSSLTDLIIDRFVSSQKLYLRRVVIRNTTGLKQFIALDSGCSAIKLCVHESRIAPTMPPISCDGVSLCRLDAKQLLSSRNKHCTACQQ